MNNPMKELYEALQAIQHYNQKAMQAIQHMSGMGQRDGSGGGMGQRDGYSGGGMGQRDPQNGPLGGFNQRNPWDNNNMFNQRDGNMPFNPYMFM